MGCELKVTVNCVVVAAITIPAAPLLKATVLLLKVVSNPVPLMIIVGALMARLAVLKVTVGATGATIVAICAVPLFPPLVVTTAVRLPVAVGSVLKATVNCVEVAEVTIPKAPRLNATVLLLAVVSNPDPLIIIVGVLIARFAVLAVTTGGATMFAT
jgi:hypothetical protein